MVGVLRKSISGIAAITALTGCANPEPSPNYDLGAVTGYGIRAEGNNTTLEETHRYGAILTCQYPRPLAELLSDQGWLNTVELPKQGEITHEQGETEPIVYQACIDALGRMKQQLIENAIDVDSSSMYKIRTNRYKFGKRPRMPLDSIAKTDVSTYAFRMDRGSTTVSEEHRDGGTLRCQYRQPLHKLRGTNSNATVAEVRYENGEAHPVSADICAMALSRLRGALDSYNMRVDANNTFRFK